MNNLTAASDSSTSGDHLRRTGPRAPLNIDYDMTSIVADLNFLDVSSSVQTLRAHLPAAAQAARRSGMGKRSHQAAVQAMTEHLFQARESRQTARDEAQSCHDKEGATRALVELDSLTEIILGLHDRMTTSHVMSLTKQHPHLRGNADLDAAAALGLMRAVSSFDPSRGTFEPWAHRRITAEVLKAVYAAQTLAITYADFSAGFAVAKARLAACEGRSHEDIAAAAGVEANAVRRLDAAGTVLSLDVVGPLMRDDTEDEESAVARDVVIAEMTVDCLLATDHLDPREHYVLVRRFGLHSEPPTSCHDIGLQLGVSREAIRQILDKAVSRLRRVARAADAA